MLNWLKTEFIKTETSVDTILSKWTQAIKDLEAHAEAKATEAVSHNVLITFYQEAKALAEAEVTKAKDVVTKLKAIFN